MLKRNRNRKHIYAPFVLKDIKVPLGRSGLKVVDWKTVDFIKKDVEQARKEAAATTE
jgi:hypothetical protein